MINKLIKYCLFALLPIFIGGNATAFSNDYTLSVNVDSYPTKCSDNESNQFVIYLSMGNVDVSDSLFGFDAYLTYDTTKIKFVNFLSTNTLFAPGSGVDFSGGNLGFEPGMISMYGTSFQFTNPKFGNKPLIAVLAQFKSDCFDTTNLNIESIDFTDEFKGHVVNFVPAAIYLKKQINTGFISAKFLDDSINVSNLNDLSEKLILNQNYNEILNNIDFVLTYNESLITMNSVSTLNDNKLKILSTENKDGKFIVHTRIDSILDNEPLLKLDYTKNIKGNQVTEISIVPVKSDNCLCSDIMNGSKLIVNWNDADTTGVVDERNSGIIINQGFGKIEVQSNYENLTKIELFDFSGKLIKEFNLFNGMSVIELDTAQLVSGAYFIHVAAGNKTKNKIILLNN